jgi:type III pantothenate kinase
MTPAVVVDVGNSAIKWGRCATGLVVETVSLPPDDPTVWEKQAKQWNLTGAGSAWVVTSVNPTYCAGLTSWIEQRGNTLRMLAEARELPLRVSLEKPDHVGIDRLLDAVAANGLRPPGHPAAIIDAGSAVTVDWIDSDGTFTGGAIMPGLRLMVRALHEHTALLPVIPIPKSTPPAPGTSTPAAMELGIFWSVVGGVAAILDAYRRKFDAEPAVFLTGGDAPVLLTALRPPVTHWPEMTLEGIRLAAEALT